MSALEKGYALIRGVFTTHFLDALELFLDEQPRECIDGVMRHPAVLLAAHGLIGPTLARTGEEHVNAKPQGPLYDAWHYDIPWDSIDGGIIPVWRFAVYFRDYSTHSGGLAVAPGSHLGKVGKQPYRCDVIESQPGDLVVWNLRAYHKAGAMNGTKPVASPRNAVFFDYGAPGVELDRYVAWRKGRKAK